jgi:hypothetical protein
VARWGITARAQRHQRLAAEVARLFVLHEGKYGSPRFTAGVDASTAALRYRV